MMGVLKTDIDAIRAVFQAQGRIPLTQACTIVAQQLGYSIPEFPRAVRDLAAQIAGSGRDYPDWSALTLPQVIAAVQALRAQAA